MNDFQEKVYDMILECSNAVQDEYWWNLSYSQTRRESLKLYEELSFRETANDHLLHMVEEDDIKNVGDLYDLWDKYTDIVHGRERTSGVVGDEMLMIIEYIIEGIEDYELTHA